MDIVLISPESRTGVSRAPLAQLENVARIEGFDGELHVAVDRSPAHAVVHAATGLGASLVIVESSGAHYATSAIGSWTDAVAATVPTPLLLLTGRADRVDRVVLGPPVPADVDPAALQFARYVASIVSRDGVATLEPDAEGWIGQLRPGDLAIVPIATFELLVGLAAPPAGAIVAAAPSPAVVRWRPPKPVEPA